MIIDLILAVVVFMLTSLFWFLFYRHNKSRWEKAAIFIESDVDRAKAELKKLFGKK